MHPNAVKSVRVDFRELKSVLAFFCVYKQTSMSALTVCDSLDSREQPRTDWVLIEGGLCYSGSKRKRPSCLTQVSDYIEHLLANPVWVLCALSTHHLSCFIKHWNANYLTVWLKKDITILLQGAREEEKGMGRRKVRYGEREKRVCQEMYSTCSRAGPVTRSAPLVELQWSGNPAINLRRWRVKPLPYPGGGCEVHNRSSKREHSGYAHQQHEKCLFAWKRIVSKHIKRHTLMYWNETGNLMI